MSRKEYSELTFTDDFMFCKVLTANPELCRELLELILAVKIREVRFAEPQKTLEESYDGKGIRMDVYVEDDANTVYDIEMQTTRQDDLPKRMRYYQSMLDMHLIDKGALYGELRKSYVIFLCLADPFNRGLPLYHFQNTCLQDHSLQLGDEADKVVINAAGSREGLSAEMVAFLDYLQGSKSESDFTRKLQSAVDDGKTHEKWRREFMTLYMKFREEREGGRAEGRAEERAAIAAEMAEKDAAIAQKDAAMEKMAQEKAEMERKYAELEAKFAALHAG